MRLLRFIYETFPEAVCVNSSILNKDFRVEHTRPIFLLHKFIAIRNYYSYYCYFIITCILICCYLSTIYVIFKCNLMDITTNFRTVA
jgi:hypothetical protein